MKIHIILFIAIGLAMDAFAVSIAGGLVINKNKFRKAISAGLFFGIFQAIMPFLGWSLGIKFQNIMAGLEYWVAFGLLFFVGMKMIVESFKISENKHIDIFNFQSLFILGIATSIDAFLLGVSLSFFAINNIFTLIIIIGMVTFLMSILGVLIGNKLGHFFENKIEALGGFILIAIGAKIFFEHILK